MKLLSARRLVPVCILSAATVAALIVPGAASASLGTQCSGVNITGQGASFQKLAQQNVWTPGFNTSTKSKTACSGTQGSKGKPTVTYNSTGSGAGLESWGVNKHAALFDSTNAYVATDEAPDALQKEEIESHEISLIPETLESIPVVQGADAVIVNLPTNCVATSKKNKGRLELDNLTLEGIFRGTITKWSQIKEDGDTVSGAGCNPEETIKVTVRKDQSGTTHIFKRYLGLISNATFTDEKEESKTWNQIAEGPASTDWPKAANVSKPAANGNGPVVALVAEKPSSIAYTGLSDARANGGFTSSPGTGGPGTAKFWAPIQNNGLVSTKQKYADPADNKDVGTLGNANCKGEEYTNGEVAFPPASVTELWNTVTTRTTQKKYTICGLSFVLSMTTFSNYPGATSASATTAANYIRFVVDSKTGGGQKLIAGNDYLALPKGAVLNEAQKGAEKINF